MKTRDLHAIDQKALEGLLDRYGLPNVVAALGLATHNQAREAREDNPQMAELWDRATARLDRVVTDWGFDRLLIGDGL